MSTGNDGKTYRVRQLPSTLIHPSQVASFLCSILPSLAFEDVKIFSLATSLNPREIPATKVATVMFDHIPPIFNTNDRRWIIPRQTAGLLRDILVDVQFQDFTPLNNVAPDEHALDCIAISGLASHPFSSWKQRGSRSNFMWLRDRLPTEMPTIRSIIYGYDTFLIRSESVKGIDDISFALIVKLNVIRASNSLAKALFFLAHSLGGIVLKQAMVTMAHSGESNNSIMDLIRGIVFFGVPNYGMETSHLLGMVKGQPNAHLVHLLSTNSSYLQTLDQQFSEIITYKNIRILSAYETKVSATTRMNDKRQWKRDGPPDLLVDRSSAIQKNSELYIPIDEDHSNLVKFGPDDQDCQAIIAFMYSVAAGAISDAYMHEVSELRLEQPAVSNATPRQQDQPRHRYYRQPRLSSRYARRNEEEQSILSISSRSIPIYQEDRGGGKYYKTRRLDHDDNYDDYDDYNSHNDYDHDHDHDDNSNDNDNNGSNGGHDDDSNYNYSLLSSYSSQPSSSYSSKSLSSYLSEPLSSYLSEPLSSYLSEPTTHIRRVHWAADDLYLSDSRKGLHHPADGRLNNRSYDHYSSTAEKPIYQEDLPFDFYSPHKRLVEDFDDYSSSDWTRSNSSSEPFSATSTRSVTMNGFERTRVSIRIFITTR